MTHIHINFTRYSDARLDRSYCPYCRKHTFFAAFFQDWYGWDSTCLRCGDRWQDGEHCPRPFARDWKKQSINAAKRLYRKLESNNQQRPMVAEREDF